MRLFRKFLSQLILACTIILSSVPTVYAADEQSAGTGNANYVGNVDIGDFGTWATDNNRKRFIGTIESDINEFQGDLAATTEEGYVPLEAKVGLAFMNAFSHIAYILNSSLVRFTIIFLIIAYGFWLFFESYTIIIGQNKVEDNIKKMVLTAIKVVAWIAVLSIGPTETFMMVMSPILYISSLLSELILDAVTSVAGVKLQGTCDAILQYVNINISDKNILNNVDAANIMCVPTRISSFSYTGIRMGWAWVKYGIGESAFAVLCGLGFIGGFLYLSWKYAFIAFGVIADLFLGIIMLPFTAIAEATSKTTYKGIAGNIYNGFLKLFNAESLSAQVSRFVGAAIHFVAMSVIIAVCAAMLSNIITIDKISMIPNLESQNFWTTVLLSALTWWLAKKASDFATEMGGKISYEMGTTLQNDAKNLWSSAKNNTKTLIKIIRNRK